MRGHMKWTQETSPLTGETAPTWKEPTSCLLRVLPMSCHKLQIILKWLVTQLVKKSQVTLDTPRIEPSRKTAELDCGVATKTCSGEIVKRPSYLGDYLAWLSCFWALIPEHWILNVELNFSIACLIGFGEHMFWCIIIEYWPSNTRATRWDLLYA